MNFGSIRVFAFLAVTLAVPATFGAAADRQQVDAQFLDHGTYKCSNCFFGPSDYYFCFKVDNRVLIGHQKIPTLSWTNPDKNYFTKYHGAWSPWQAPGSTVKLSYNDKYIWLPRADGKKDIRLTQDYTKDIFITEPQCRAAVKKSN